MSDYLLIAAAALFAGFHSGSETGTYCVNRLRLRLRAEQGHSAARALLNFTRRSRLAISTLLIGTNVGVYVATVLSTGKLNQLLAGVHAELYSSIILPPILLVFCDIMPKSFFQHHADVLMYRAIWPLRVSQTVFYPVALLLRWVGGLPHLLLGKSGAPLRPAFTRESFRFHLTEGAAHGVLSGFQRTVAENILRLRSLDVAQVMTPLADAVMVPETASHSDLLKAFGAHRYSRIPVYREGRERVVGVINVIDVASIEREPPPTAELAREVLSLRKGTSVADALWALRQARQQFAVVTDAQGGALGIATVKDLVEEIVGELEAW